MIRQVSAASWKSLISSKGSQQNQDQFFREFEDFRKDWAGRKQALSAQYKGNLTSADYLADKAVLQTELENTMLAFGYYESVTQEELDDIFKARIVAAVKKQPALMLSIVTQITNYYRGQNSKADLTEAQVQTRLMS